jgi:hypothetical protein
MAELMRFRIPRGWVVLDNKFFDTDPKVEEPSELINNWYEGFVEDVLWIRETRINERGEYEIPKINHFDIDISWLPDSSAKGKYYATLSWNAADEVIGQEKFQSKSRFEIRDKIEFWMSSILENYQECKNRVIKHKAPEISPPEPEKPFDFGGLPQRDLKKNLGCG